MNYQHHFHAGNFADVFKHVVLVSLLNALKAKEKPFFYLDTHAGAGHYPLSSDPKDKYEYPSGIGKVWQKNLLSSENPSLDALSLDNFSLENSSFEAIKDYLTIVSESGFPEFYPGSPYIAHALLRNIDRMALCEKDLSLCKTLKKVLTSNNVTSPTVEIHHQDGYLGLKAFLPPKEKRGLILIDPPYESKEDWDQIIEGLTFALNRFPMGVYAIWYPIKDESKGHIQRWLKKIETLLASKKLQPHKISLLNLELSLNQVYLLQLQQCGLLILNCPFPLNKHLKQLCTYVQEILTK